LLVRPLLLSLAALQAASVGCGPRKGDSADAGARDFGLGDLPGDGAPGRPLCEEVQELPFDPIAVEVMLVFDRSESMAVAFGDGTRQGALADLLRGLVPGYQDRISFGFQVFPSRGGCPAGYVRGCCAEPPSVGVGLRNAPAVLAAIDQVAPVEGNTPTAEALRLARRYLATVRKTNVQRYVLLATDGKPSCNGQGQLDDPRTGPDGGPLGAACSDALAETEALVSDDVKVIVLGIGAELAGGADEGAACLDQLARRGGAARVDGPPAYHTAEHPEALERSLRAIFGATVSRPCLVELQKTPADRAGVRVLFDGEEVPRNRVNGWDFEGPSDPTDRASRRLMLFGEACRRVDRFQVSRVQVQYGCPCENERACE
jgi:hypothetical protein